MAAAAEIFRPRNRKQKIVGNNNTTWEKSPFINTIGKNMKTKFKTKETEREDRLLHSSEVRTSTYPERFSHQWHLSEKSVEIEEALFRFALREQEERLWGCYTICLLVLLKEIERSPKTRYSHTYENQARTHNTNWKRNNPHPLTYPWRRGSHC